MSQPNKSLQRCRTASTQKLILSSSLKAEIAALVKAGSSAIFIKLLDASSDCLSHWQNSLRLDRYFTLKKQMVMHTGELSNTFSAQLRISIEASVQFTMVFTRFLLLPSTPPPLTVLYLETALTTKQFYLLGRNTNRIEEQILPLGSSYRSRDNAEHERWRSALKNFMSPVPEIVCWRRCSSLMFFLWFCIKSLALGAGGEEKFNAFLLQAFPDCYPARCFITWLPVCTFLMVIAKQMI